MGGAEWADAFRVLGPDESATPGPFRAVPWQRYFLDLFADPTVDWVVVLKAAQVGISELVRCAIGRWSLLDPGDVLWVMADEKSANKSMEKLKSMFRNTPALQHLLPPDNQRFAHGKRVRASLKELVLLNGMRVVLAWASSAASLASDPFMRVVLDETGLYPVKVGREGSPIGLAEERTKTFGRRRKVIVLSKPAHAEDLICTSHAECLAQMERHVPCPDCETLQPLQWERVRWLDSEGSEMAAANSPTDPMLRLVLAAHVEQSQSAWIECEHCGEAITDVRAADSDPAAEWRRTGEDLTTETRRRGAHISELYHWSKTTSDIVARFLRAVKAADLQNFYTGTLGLPYEQERGTLTPALFASKAVHKPGVAPAWSTAIIAAADTQGDHFWYVVRAWGKGFKSRLLSYGRAETFAELRAETLEKRWLVEGTDQTAGAVRLVIDAGGTTSVHDGSRSRQVYTFAAETPHVTALKGTGEKKGSNLGKPITWTKVSFGADKDRELSVIQPHANYWRDQCAALCRGPAWEESTQAADTEYKRQMCGQRQVWEQAAGGVGHWVWRKKRGRHDHLWDASYMCTVGAEIEDTNGRELLVSAVQRQAAAKAQRFFEDDEESDDWLGQTRRGGTW
ncbi:MAG: terminase gpA endonuclease subunit [Alphaproteobacteria bacterium]